MEWIMDTTRHQLDYRVSTTSTGKQLKTGFFQWQNFKKISILTPPPVGTFVGFWGRFRLTNTRRNWSNPILPSHTWSLIDKIFRIPNMTTDLSDTDPRFLDTKNFCLLLYMENFLLSFIYKFPWLPEQQERWALPMTRRGFTASNWESTVQCRFCLMT